MFGAFINKVKAPGVQNLVCILVGVSIFCFVIYKSATTSLTHDESFTYLHFIPQKFMDIISYKTPYTNNHILNTLLIKGSEYLFGNSELAIRLPNNLSLILYLTYTFLLLRKMNRQLIILPFLLMILNPYLIDFFGLARGYGLSIAFLMMSLYHLLNFFEKDKKKDLMLFNLGAFLAIFSYFTLVYFYLSALIIFNLLLFVGKKNHNSGNLFRWIFKQNVINLVFLIFIFLTAFEPFRRTMKSVPIDFGGKTGLIHDTIRSLLIKSYMGLPAFWISILTGFICAVILALFLYLVYIVVRRNLSEMDRLKPVIIVNWLTVLTAILICLAHYIIDMDFPIQRFAIFIYPLIMLNIISLTCLRIHKFKNIFTGLIVLLAILTVVNFGCKLNIRYYYDWTYDADTKSAMRALVQDYEQQPDKEAPISLGVSWIFEPTMNYYRQLWKLNWLEPVDREAPALKDDYIYVIRFEYQPTDLIEEQVIFTSAIADAMLVKR